MPAMHRSNFYKSEFGQAVQILHSRVPKVSFFDSDWCGIGFALVPLS
jgi:hypothetical protein